MRSIRYRAVSHSSSKNQAHNPNPDLFDIKDCTVITLYFPSIVLLLEHRSITPGQISCPGRGVSKREKEDRTHEFQVQLSWQKCSAALPRLKLPPIPFPASTLEGKLPHSRALLSGISRPVVAQKN